MAYLTNGTLNYNLTLEEACCARKQAYIRERNMMDPTYPDPNDERFTDPAPVFTILNNQLYRDGVAIGKIYNNKTGKVVEIDTITEDSFSYKDTSEAAIITWDISVTTVSKLTGLKSIYIQPYLGFCRLTLSNGDVVEIEGSGAITDSHISQYRNSGITTAEFGKLCTSIAGFGSINTLETAIIGDGVISIKGGAFSYCSAMKSLTIGNNVATIGGSAFGSCSSLLNIVIPSSVTNMGEYCFGGCRNLTSIVFEEGFNASGQSWFQNCSNLTNVTFPNSLTSIGNYAFYNCSKLTTVTIGSGVTNIGSNAFGECISLTSIIIPDSVTSIGDSTFYGCSMLRSITIPDSVTTIGSNAFYNCIGLNNIISLAATAPTIQNNTFYDVKTNGTLYVPQGSTGYDVWMSTSSHYLGYFDWTKVELLNTNLLVYYDIQDISAPTTIFTNYDSSVKSINIDGKETISGFSQGNVTYLFDSVGQHIIQFGFNSPTTVGNSAPLFNNLTTIKRVVIPNTFTAIGSNAFLGCTGLTSVTIGNGVTNIGNNAFINCPSLTSITIPDSVTSIGMSAFASCLSLTSATIGSGVTSIGSSVFAGCSSLTSVTIPNGVTSIGDGAFQNCSNLTSITIPNSVISMGARTFLGCTKLTTVEISDSVTSIGNQTFNSCSGLTSVTIPNSVTSIDSNAFGGCSGLTSVTIGSGVISIGSEAFGGCSGLINITIGSGVETIGQNAFRSCSNLTSITSLATTAPTIQSNTFYIIKTGGTLYVPQGSAGYDTWMGTGNYYLGKYGWTKVEKS